MGVNVIYSLFPNEFIMFAVCVKLYNLTWCSLYAEEILKSFMLKMCEK